MTTMKTIGCLLATAILLGAKAHPFSNAANYGNHNNNHNYYNNNNRKSEEPACLVGFGDCRNPANNVHIIQNVKICCVPGYFVQAHNGACFCSSTESMSRVITDGDYDYSTYGVRPMTKEEKQAFKQRMREEAERVNKKAHKFGNAANYGNHNNNHNYYNNNNRKNEEPACLVGLDDCRNPANNVLIIQNVKICCVPGYFVQAYNGACFCSATESMSRVITDGDYDYSTYGVRPMTKEEKQAFKQRMREEAEKVKKDMEELQKRLRKEEEERERNMEESQKRLRKEAEERQRHHMEELQKRLRKEEEERERNMEDLQKRLRTEAEERQRHHMEQLQKRLRKEEEERNKRWQERQRMMEEQERLRREREERNRHNNWWNWN